MPEPSREEGRLIMNFFFTILTSQASMTFRPALADIMLYGSMTFQIRSGLDSNLVEFIVTVIRYRRRAVDRETQPHRTLQPVGN